MPATGWKEKDDRTIVEMRAYQDEHRLDAFIPWKVPHLAYLTNYYDPLHANISWEERTALLVVPRADDAFVAGRHEPVAGIKELGTSPWWLTERHGVDRPGTTMLAGAAELLKKKGLGRGRIGLELKWMPAAVCDCLRAALPEAEFVAADTLVPQIRFIKTPREQRLLQKAGDIGLRAMEAYMQALRQGASTEEAQLIRAKRALDYGGEWVGGAHKIAWTGGTPATPAWWDTEARETFLNCSIHDWRATIKNVPCYVSHFETLFQFYFCDMAWHEFVGAEPAADQLLDFGNRQATFAEAQRDFDILRRVQREALEMIRPEMNHIDAKKAVDAFLAADPEAPEHITHYYIHGVGLEVHEEPLLHTPMPDPTPLDGPIYFRPGAVVSSEWFTRLWTVEEPFVMTATGWEPLVELKGLTDPAAL